MTMLTLFVLVFSISSTLLIVKQPLSVGFLVLFNSFMLSLCIFFSGETWFGFILFLIYIGGMLVMFAYVTALTPNLVFKFKGIFMFFSLILMFWFMMFLKLGSLGVMMNKFLLETPVDEMYFKSGAYLFSYLSFKVILGLVLILFFILLCVVKICYLNKGSLRPFK